MSAYTHFSTAQTDRDEIISGYLERQAGVSGWADAMLRVPQVDPFQAATPAPSVVVDMEPRQRERSRYRSREGDSDKIRSTSRHDGDRSRRDKSSRRNDSDDRHRNRRPKYGDRDGRRERERTPPPPLPVLASLLSPSNRGRSVPPRPNTALPEAPLAKAHLQPQSKPSSSIVSPTPRPIGTYVPTGTGTPQPSIHASTPQPRAPPPSPSVMQHSVHSPRLAHRHTPQPQPAASDYPLRSEPAPILVPPTAREANEGYVGPRYGSPSKSPPRLRASRLPSLLKRIFGCGGDASTEGSVTVTAGTRRGRSPSRGESHNRMDDRGEARSNSHDRGRSADTKNRERRKRMQSR